MGEPDEPDIANQKNTWARKFLPTGRQTRDHNNHSSPQGPFDLPRHNPTNDSSTSEKTDHARQQASHNASDLQRSVSERIPRSPSFQPSHDTVNDTTTSLPPPAQPPVKSEDEGTGDSTIKPDKGPWGTRFINASKRGWQHTYEALTHSWINVLLVCVPAGIAVDAAGLNPAVVFAVNAVAIIPLAGLLTHATESVAMRLGDTLGALLNVSFGNAVELIIFIIALVKNEIRITQASLLGSILSNLLLILGMAFTLGGLRFQEQIYNSTVTQMSACLLSLSVMSLLLPTAFHASFADSANADSKTLKVSRGTSVILLIIYVLYLVFQLKSHAYMYESTPQHVIDEESHPGVLHDIMDSSSSSSSSSDSSDTDTSGSHTTTKRIKRAFRNRKRRKSSASSITAPSLPSVISSPSQERSTGILDTPSVANNGGSRRMSALGAIASGDEADADNDDRRFGSEPRVRDFVENIKQDLAKEKERRKTKKHKKREKKRLRQLEKLNAAGEGPSGSHQDATAVQTGKPPGAPRVEFEQFPQVIEPTTGPVPRKSFGLRQLPLGRPALPKMLSQNVFVTPPPRATDSPNFGVVPARVPSGLRRTNSLPDHLNRQTSAPFARTEVLPPYPRAGQRNARATMRTDSGINGEGEEIEKPLMSRTSAAVLLLVSTALVAVCAEFMVDAIPGMIASSSVSQTFIGLIILPIVSNAAEHVTAVTVATKNKMDLAIGVAVGSSIQIAIFVTPLVVILGWIIGRDMTLYFSLFETVSLFVTVFVVNFLVLDGRSNYLEGSLLMAAYAIIA